MTRKIRLAGRRVFGGALMSVWVLLPLMPILAALATWTLGIH